MVKDEKNMNTIRKVLKINILKFIKLNFLTSNIKRKKGVYIIPFKGSIIELDKDATIFLNGNLKIGINQLKGSKAQTYIRIAKNAVWNINGDVLLFFNTFIDIHENAIFDTKLFSANSGSVIVVDKHISIGNDTMLGRNITIYDSDFHTIYDESDKPCNYPKEVIIEDHVWLTNNITVLKGTTIGKNSLISAMSLVSKDLPSNSMCGGIPAKVIKQKVKWSRNNINQIKEL